MTIELRLTDTNPPEPDPPRTIYRDIANLPDPTSLGMTVRFFNHDDVSLYFKITGSGSGYTFTPITLGVLDSGLNDYINLDNFASKAKPTAAQLPNGEMGETITLTLTAYTDSGYNNLKWTFTRNVQVIWINSADPAFTVNAFDNFDDGTVQGWDVITESDEAITLAVATDYVLSSPYSIKATHTASFTTGGAGRMYKSFNTPNKDTIYAVADIRMSAREVYGFASILELKHDDTLLIHLGKASNIANQLPKDRWIRLVAPLPKNSTVEIRISFEWYDQGFPKSAYQWLDDFKIISK